MNAADLIPVFLLDGRRGWIFANDTDPDPSVVTADGSPMWGPRGAGDDITLSMVKTPPRRPAIARPVQCQTAAVASIEPPAITSEAERDAIAAMVVLRVSPEQAQSLIALAKQSGATTTPQLIREAFRLKR